MRAEGRFAVARSVLEVAKSSRNVGDRKLAASLFADPEDDVATTEEQAADFKRRVHKFVETMYDGNHVHMLENLKRLIEEQQREDSKAS